MAEKKSSLLERNVKVLEVKSLLSGTYDRIHRVIYQPFILSLNPSMSSLGILEGIGGYQGLLGALIKPFFGWLSDRMKKKPFIIIGSLLMSLSISLFLISSITQTFLFIIPAVILMGASSLAMPIIESLVAESVETSKRAMAYSRIMLATITPGIFSPLIGGIIADRYGFKNVLYIGIIIQGVIILFLIRFLRENPASKRIVNFTELRSFFLRNFSPPKNLRNIYLMNMLDAFAMCLSLNIMYGLLRVNFEFSNSQLGLIDIINAASMMFSHLVTGRMVTKYGSKNLLIISYCVYLAYISGIIASKDFLTVLLFQIPGGICVALWSPAHQTLMANSTTQTERAEAMGRISFYRGISGFFSPFIGGLLYEQYGYSAPLLTSIIWGIGVTSYIYFYIRVKDNRLI